MGFNISQSTESWDLILVNQYDYITFLNTIFQVYYFKTTIDYFKKVLFKSVIAAKFLVILFN